MIEKQFIVRKECLLWDDEEAAILTKDFVEVLVGLPLSGTLYLNLKKCTYIEDMVIFDMIIRLLNVMGRGIFRDKHLIIQEANEEILEIIREMCCSLNLLFINLDHQGVLRLEGRLEGLTREIFETILEERFGPLGITAADLNKEGFGSNQKCSNALKLLYSPGFLTRNSDTGRRGRAVLYQLFKPNNNKCWSKGVSSLLWRI